MHVVLMAAASGDCGVSALSPLPTSLSWESQSPPTVSPINIPAGRPELVGSLGAETPPNTSGRHRDGEDKKNKNRGMEGEVRIFNCMCDEEGRGRVCKLMYKRGN